MNFELSDFVTVEVAVLSSFAAAGADRAAAHSMWEDDVGAAIEVNFVLGSVTRNYCYLGCCSGGRTSACG